MSHKARTLVAKLRRQSRVRPYRERAEITPLLSAQNGHKTNGKSTAIDMNSHLYPIVEVFEEGKPFKQNVKLMFYEACDFIWKQDRNILIQTLEMFIRLCRYAI